MRERPDILSPYVAALRGIRGGLIKTAGLSAIISVLMLTGSIYMLQIYDRVLTSGSIPTLLALFAIVVGLYGFLAFYDGLRMRLLSRLSLQLDDALAQRCFAADMETRRLPGVLSTFTGDLEVLRTVMSGPAMLALFDLPFTLVFLAVLFLLHPILGGLTVLGMALAVCLALMNRVALARPMVTSHEIMTMQQRFARGAQNSAGAIAALGMSGAVARHWLGFHQSKLHHQQQGFEPSESLSALSRSLRMLLQSGLLTAAAWLVIEGSITAGAIVAASILSGRALAPVDQLIGQWRNLAQARAAHDRLRALPAETTPRKVNLPALSGLIEVEGLSHWAQPDQHNMDPMLDDLSFRIDPGEGLGIIGPSACGKSTLARLIVGALSPDAGEIRFNGATATQWDPDLLGRQIGYLPQNVLLLPGTIRDNIARFDPTARDDEVIHAAQAAGVHEMILRLPNGYGTEIGEGDPPLSGGQMQRIGLARALFGNPKILVLDEPNAHLDIAGETALARSLEARRQEGCTVIVLAHRAGAFAAVDRLMLLQDGKIQQDGPRDEVLLNLTPQHVPKPASIPGGVVIKAEGHRPLIIRPQSDDRLPSSKPVLVKTRDSGTRPVLTTISPRPGE
ncbi:MAG: type I secretion system permease/ATPase [Pseudorhodobacter sp.]